MRMHAGHVFVRSPIFYTGLVLKGEILFLYLLSEPTILSLG
jgi:hypothetical protein